MAISRCRPALHERVSLPDKIHLSQFVTVNSVPSSRSTLVRPSCAFGRSGKDVNKRRDDETPLIQPSLVIPPPSTGSQYGRNRVLDIAFGSPSSDGGGGGGGGWGGGGRDRDGGRGGSGGGGGGRSGGGGFPGDRRFGLLPRMLIIIQFLCWSTVLYMLVDTVVNSSTRAANRVWNRNRSPRGQQQQEERQGQQQQEQEAGQQQEGSGQSGEGSGGGQVGAQAQVQMQGVEPETVLVLEVVEVEEGTEPEEQVRPGVVGIAGSNGVGSRQGPQGGETETSPTSLAASGASAPLAASAAGVAAHAAAAEVSDEQVGVLQPSEGAAAGQHQAAGAVSGQGQGEGKGQGQGHSRASFARYEGPQPVQYPTLAVFIMIMGSVGFFSTLG